jgi:hypothetical protein
MWDSIGYEDPGPMWLCSVVIISKCLEEHAACYQKLAATGYLKTSVITCKIKLCHTAQDHTVRRFSEFKKKG